MNSCVYLTSAGGSRLLGIFSTLTIDVSTFPCNACGVGFGSRFIFTAFIILGSCITVF